MSRNPGVTQQPVASITSASAGTSSSAPISAIRPSRTITCARRAAPPVPS
ncbi:MAG: hypothetical protein V9E99_13185 [Microthrixaceae bacterium]